MQFSDRISLLTRILLIICVVEVCHGQQLLCYVCDNCTKITVETPLMQCDEGFFNSGGTTMPSTMTTTTQTTTDMISTTDVITTTNSIDSTTSEVTESTTPSYPTPPSVTPSTAIPTPPNPGTLPSTLENVQINATTKLYTPSSEIRARAQRQVMQADAYTYHCYRMKKSVNGIYETERGCTRVTTAQSVCTNMENSNNGTKISGCFACDNPRCNSSSGLGGVSLLTFFIGITAALLRYN